MLAKGATKSVLHPRFFAIFVPYSDLLEDKMKKIKLAILALLGFSTACSTVKNTNDKQVELPAEETTHTPKATQPTEEEELKIERIQLMYGTPSPRPTQE